MSFHPHPDAIIGADTETERFAPGYMAPRIACLSFDSSGTGAVLAPTPEARDVFMWLLTQHTVWHNAPYDLCCALAWWNCSKEVIDALENDRIGDTWVIQRIAIIGGLAPFTDLSLDVLHAYHGLGELPKDPAIRLSYGPLRNQPLEAYSNAQQQYAKDDATATRKLYSRQCKWLDKDLIHWSDVCALTRKRVWLEACKDWGLRTDAKKLDALTVAVAKQIESMRLVAQQPALLDDEDPTQQHPDCAFVRADGTGAKHRQQALVAQAYLAPKPLPLPGKPIKERLAAAIPLVPPSILTTKPRVSKNAPPPKPNAKPKKPWKPSIKTARNVLEESGDERLVAFAEYGSWSSLESTLPHYLCGATEPIHTKWGVADSTRVTSSQPQVQNLGTDNGIRECFIPRPGHCFISVDHGGLENATLAQFGIWYLHDRSFADFVNAGKDLHTLVGSKIHGCTYDEGVALKKGADEAFLLSRDAAKPIDFGAPGGAGWRRLKISAKQLQGLNWTEAQAKFYRQAWVDAVPVGAKMHAWVDQHQQADGRFTVPIPGTTITRRNVTFCSACNNGFQPLGAVIEGAVGWAMFRERLLDPRSPLARCAMVNYVHDEFIFEVPLDLVDAAARRLEEIMHEIPKTVMPDVVLNSKAIAMAYWSHAARRILIDGQLRVWPLLCSNCRAPHDYYGPPAACSCRPKEDYEAHKNEPCRCACGAPVGAFLSDVEAYGTQNT
jgi:hypothetical protein